MFFPSNLRRYISASGLKTHWKSGTCVHPGAIAEYSLLVDAAMGLDKDSPDSLQNSDDAVCAADVENNSIISTRRALLSEYVSQADARRDSNNSVKPSTQFFDVERGMSRVPDVGRHHRLSNEKSIPKTLCVL